MVLPSSCDMCEQHGVCASCIRTHLPPPPPLLGGGVGTLAAAGPASTANARPAGTLASCAALRDSTRNEVNIAMFATTTEESSASQLMADSVTA